MRRIDDFTIALYTDVAGVGDGRSLAIGPSKLFAPSSAVGETITLPGHGFTNGTPVTYLAPTPNTFTGLAVNAQPNPASPGWITG